MIARGFVLQVNGVFFKQNLHSNSLFSPHYYFSLSLVVAFIILIHFRGWTDLVTILYCHVLYSKSNSAIAGGFLVTLQTNYPVCMAVTIIIIIIIIYYWQTKNRGQWCNNCSPMWLRPVCWGDLQWITRGLFSNSPWRMWDVFFSP